MKEFTRYEEIYDAEYKKRKRQSEISMVILAAVFLIGQIAAAYFKVMYN